jgi:hypothetical protein
MNKPAIVAARKLPRSGYIVLICGALLGSVAATAPAQSADLYPYPQYSYPQYTAYPSYYRNCYPCGCRPCCNPCCNPCGYSYRPYIRPAPVVERHWDYWERRYPYPYPHRYPYYPNGYAGGYPSYPDGYAGGYPYPGGYAGGARPHLGFGGVQYQYSQAAPISYEYEAPPRAPYDYEASARPAYDYDASPRPPIGIPGGYYNAGYLQ